MKNIRTTVKQTSTAVVIIIAILVYVALTDAIFHGNITIIRKSLFNVVTYYEQTDMSRQRSTIDVPLEDVDFSNYSIKKLIHEGIEMRSMLF